jgi:hypothetical protein
MEHRSRSAADFRFAEGVDLDQKLQETQREIDKLLDDIKDFRGGIALEQEVLKKLDPQHEAGVAQGALEVIALEDVVLKMMLEDLVKAMKAKRQLQADIECMRSRPGTRDRTVPAGYSPK